MNYQALTYNISIDNQVKFGKRSQSVYAIPKTGGVLWIVAFAGVQCKCRNHTHAAEIEKQLSAKRENKENHQAILDWLIAQSV